MPISDAEKKVLLERLELARVAKQKKAEEAKAAKAVKAVKAAPAPEPEQVIAPPVVTPAPAPVPAPAPEERPPISEPIDIPEVPDLVAASRKPAKGKKVALPDSDSEEEVAMPKKKKAVAKKDTPFLKIKLYKEPQDKVAFQNLLQAVAGEVSEEEEEIPSPPVKQYHKGPQVLQRVGAAPRNSAPKSISKEEIEAAEMRRLALQIFG
jgi:hypothetical protein